MQKNVTIINNNYMVPLPRTASAVFPQISEILSMGWVDIPEQFNGHGAPGNTLEYLLNVKENNMDSPDFYDWELKFHGGASLLTLMHKDPKPRGIMKDVVDTFGWENEKGQISFRHTLKGKSDRGFKVYNENDRISVLNESNPNILPYWDHNTILEQIAGKLRRLILVNGKVKAKERKVIYTDAIAWWNIDMLGFCAAIEKGVVYIDFDARTKFGRGTTLRNHGTKFRIKPRDLPKIYNRSQQILPEQNISKLF